MKCLTDVMWRLHVRRRTGCDPAVTTWKIRHRVSISSTRVDYWRKIFGAYRRQRFDNNNNNNNNTYRIHLRLFASGTHPRHLCRLLCAMRGAASTAGMSTTSNACRSASSKSRRRCRGHLLSSSSSSSPPSVRLAFHTPLVTAGLILCTSVINGHTTATSSLQTGTSDFLAFTRDYLRTKFLALKVGFNSVSSY